MPLNPNPHSPVPCPTCGAPVSPGAAGAGETVRCPNCQADFVLPGPSAQAPVDVEPVSLAPARPSREQSITPGRPRRARPPVDDLERGRPRASSKGIWILVLSIGGGLLLLCGLGCGGLLYWFGGMFRELPGVQASADAFLTDLGAQRIDNAYARTSKVFQRSQNLNQFRAWVKQYPALTTHTSRSYSGINIFQQPGETQGIVRATVLGPQNSLSFTLVLVKEDEQWKVKSLTVP